MRVDMLDLVKIFYSRFRGNEDGATAMEYGILVALIAIALMLGLNEFYESLDAAFVAVDENLTTATEDADPPE